MILTRSAEDSTFVVFISLILQLPRLISAINPLQFSINGILIHITTMKSEFACNI